VTADDEQDPNDWLRNLLGGHRAENSSPESRSISARWSG